MRPWTMSRLIVVTSVVFCFSLKAEVRRERIFCERQERREALGARHLFSAEPQVARAWRKKMRGVRADAPHTTRLAARAFDPCTRALFTASGIDTPNARLTHGTERSRSRWSERTRGAVSVTDGLNAIDFCAEFRSAIAPDDAPVARRVATPDMAHSGSLVGRRLMKGAAQDGKQGHYVELYGGRVRFKFVPHGCKVLPRVGRPYNCATDQRYCGLDNHSQSTQ